MFVAASRGIRSSLSSPAAATLLVAVAGVLGAGCAFDPEPPTVAADPGSPRAKATPLVAPNWVSEPRRFAADVQVTSFVATPGRLLGATIGPAPSKLVSFSESGGITPFAPHFAPGEDRACTLESAPGLGTFQPDAIFVGCGAEVWQVSPNGAAALLCASLPAADGAIVDLCFDTVGGQGFDLLALAESGALFRIQSDGQIHRAGDAGPGATGIAIASARFTAFAGRILAAYPAESEVRALGPGGDWTPVVQWSGVSGLCSIPDEPRAFGTTSSALFLATAQREVFRFALADLAQRGGQMILTTEHSSGSGLIVPAGGGYSVRPFSRFVGAEVAVAAVPRPLVQSVAVDIWPGMQVGSITMGAEELVPVAVLSGVGFDPAILSGGELSFAGAAPVPLGRPVRVGTYCHVNGDGVPDLVLCFRPADMLLEPGDHALQFEAMALAGDRIHGSERILVVTP